MPGRFGEGVVSFLTMDAGSSSKPSPRSKAERHGGTVWLAWAPQREPGLHCEQEPPAPEVDLGTSKHRSLEHLLAINLVFDRTDTPRQRQGSFHGSPCAALWQSVLTAPLDSPWRVPTSRVARRVVSGVCCFSTTSGSVWLGRCSRGRRPCACRRRCA